MTRQLILPIAQKHRYSVESFVCHDGVQSALAHADLLIHEKTFRSTIIFGARRTGKTHTLITIFDKALSSQRFVGLWDGPELRSHIERGDYEELLAPGDVLLIDDLDEYLQLCEPGSSGPFVGFFEHCRLHGVSIIASMEGTWAGLPCDDHVLSRLKLCSLAEIEDPDEGSLPSIIEHIGRQRGLQLSAKKIKFLQRRVGRKINEIEDCLDRVLQLSNAQGRPFDFSLLADAVIPLLPE